MEFVSAQDFKFSSRKINKRLSEDGKIVVTKNGKPTALVLDLRNADLEQTLNDLYKLRTIRLLNSVQAKSDGREPISDEEIEAEIQAVRAERKAKQAANV
jgi:PHD/YefM family antitoxin component YafN of YafNO toxin-antitoxin module